LSKTVVVPVKTGNAASKRERGIGSGLAFVQATNAADAGFAGVGRRRQDRKEEAD
jgi:hypothetical protein